MRIISSILMIVLALIIESTPTLLHAQGGVPQPDGFRFYWPGSCVQAIQRSTQFYWRARQDSLRYDPSTDTILSVSAQIAQTCAEQFNNAPLVSRDYVPLAQVYLAAHNDSAAAAVISRRLALPDVQSAGPRAWVLADIVDAYLTASPPRLEQAQRYLDMLHALPESDAAVGKVRAYRALATYYWRVGDTTGLVATSERLILAGKSLSPHDRNDYGRQLFAGYRFIADVRAIATSDSLAPLAIMGRAKEDIGSLMNVEPMIRRYMLLAGLYNSKAQRIVAHRWLTSQTEQADTLHPKIGKFNLIVFQPFRHNIPQLRRLASEFQKMLNVVGILGTVGNVRGVGPLTPDAEEALLRKYYGDELDVHFPLSLEFVHFTRMPDGRRIADTTANEQAYRARSGATLILIDPHGTIKGVWTSWDKSYENRIAEVLRELSGRTQ